MPSFLSSSVLRERQLKSHNQDDSSSSMIHHCTKFSFFQQVSVHHNTCKCRYSLLTISSNLECV